MYRPLWKPAALLLACLSLPACDIKQEATPRQEADHNNAPKMHPSWDADNDGVNDCENDGSCDDSINYSQPRPAAIPWPDCTNSPDAVLQQLICQDPALTQLSNRLSDTLSAARDNASNMQLSLLTAEQLEWPQELEGCQEDDDQIACLTWHYQRRITELQIRHQLVPARGPFHFHCPDFDLSVNFYESAIPSSIAVRGTEESLMHIAPSASGSKYESDSEIFWEHQGTVRLIWGVTANEVTCSPAN
jgi:uncharacterized protein